LHWPIVKKEKVEFPGKDGDGIQQEKMVEVMILQMRASNAVPSQSMISLNQSESPHLRWQCRYFQEKYLHDQYQIQVIEVFLQNIRHRTMDLYNRRLPKMPACSAFITLRNALSMPNVWQHDVQ
jgi:hypothetical protein